MPRGRTGVSVRRPTVLGVRVRRRLFGGWLVRRPSGHSRPVLRGGFVRRRARRQCGLVRALLSVRHAHVVAALALGGVVRLRKVQAALRYVALRSAEFLLLTHRQRVWLCPTRQCWLCCPKVHCFPAHSPSGWALRWRRCRVKLRKRPSKFAAIPRWPQRRFCFCRRTRCR